MIEELNKNVRLAPNGIKLFTSDQKVYILNVLVIKALPTEVLFCFVNRVRIGVLRGVPAEGVVEDGCIWSEGEASP